MYDVSMHIFTFLSHFYIDAVVSFCIVGITNNVLPNKGNIMKEFKLIENWANDRNLIKGSSPTVQMIKLYEEFGELAGGMARQNESVIKDSIGDCVVVLTIIMAQTGRTITKGPNVNMPQQANLVLLEAGVQIGQLAKSIKNGDGKESFYVSMAMSILGILCDVLGIDFEECVKIAYNDIKDHKGQMLDGVFIKEDDLKPLKGDE